LEPPSTDDPEAPFKQRRGDPDKQNGVIVGKLLDGLVAVAGMIVAELLVV